MNGMDNLFFWESMDDRLRVEDADIELTSISDIDNLLRPIWK